MKKATLTFFLFGLLASCLAQPEVSSLRCPSSAELFGLFELSFTLREYDNPYDPEMIHAFADFVGPQNQRFTVDAFYYEGYDFKQQNNVELAEARENDKGWRVRFTPNAVGKWTLALHVIDTQGKISLTSFGGEPLSFHCEEVPTANGFISLANARYLKRDVVADGKQREQSFFPVGPNIAWYDAKDFGRYAKPYGIYDYVNYIDLLTGQANYFRLWINRYQFLSIYGPENTELVNGRPRMYFESSMNQKDSAELDFIVQYAKEHDITLMPCIFNFRNFMHKEKINPPTDAHPAMPSDWINNPYNIVLGLKSPYQFFTNAEAKRITKNLLRYIVARWGYATNILAWELWNEITNMANGQDISQKTLQDISDWHAEMAGFLRSIDPYQHLITTSLGGTSKSNWLFSRAFSSLDIVQNHNYQNIQKMSSSEQLSVVLYRGSAEASMLYPDKPFFMGEFGFGQDNPARQYVDKDPYGIDLHNSLWSSTFSGSMGPASFWFWGYLKRQDLYKRFRPVLTFLSSLPILSDSFQPATTGEIQGKSMVFPNNLATYYMINSAADSIIGWSQDTAFCYQSLRYLTDVAGNNGHFVDNQVTDAKGYVYTLDASKKPRSSSRNNTITIPVGNQPVGTRYVVRWFDSETGCEIPSETTTVKVKSGWLRQRSVSFEFPSSIRDPKSGAISNTFGDAAFVVCKISD